MKDTIISKLQKLKEENKTFQWMTEEGYQILSNGYLENETPVERTRKICGTAALELGMPELEDKFFSYVEKRWLGFSSPIWANLGTKRGLPISCFSIHVGDSVDSIFNKVHEMAMLTKVGGGVGIYLNEIRGAGSKIKGNGKSEGVVPWAKVFDAAILATNQGGTRKGANAFYLDIEHADFTDFTEMRRQTGDLNRRTLNSNHAVCISDEFMNKLESGDETAKKKWIQLLVTRFETGEPYIMFTGNVNKYLPDTYLNNLHKFPRIKPLLTEEYYKDKKSYINKIKSGEIILPVIVTSNICTEILQYTDTDYTFVCDIASVNLTKWDEWKEDPEFIYYCIFFLDAVMNIFIRDSEGIPGLENARKSAITGRSIGLGGMGWHTLLQKKKLGFESLQAKLLNTQIWKYIDKESKKASKDLGKKYGIPEWCEGTGYRNAHRLAIAPTVSNSMILSSTDEMISPSVEPFDSNAFLEKTAKGSFIRKNKELEKVLEKYGKNESDVWKSIVSNEGSVQHLVFLSKEEKEVFMTAREINQFVIIKQAADRQKYIDQSQSINLFFSINATPKYMSETVKEAWKSGVKTLYYVRTSSVLKSDSGSREYERKAEECVWCQ